MKRYSLWEEFWVHAAYTALFLIVVVICSVLSWWLG
jgi:hypothetical protein